MNKEFYQCQKCKCEIEMKLFTGKCPLCGFLETTKAIEFKLQEGKSEIGAAKADLDDAYNAKQEAYQDMKNQVISYDEFREYMDDYNEKNNIYKTKKERYQEMKEYYQELLNHLKTL